MQTKDTATPPDERVLGKVKKLLALARKSTYEGEAQSALAKAQELMVKHGLEQAAVEAEAPAEKEMGLADIHRAARTPWWVQQLGAVIAQNFRCRFLLLEPKAAFKRWSFLGLADDVRLALEAYWYARDEMAYQADRAKKKTYRFSRKDFYHGFILGLRAKFREQVEKNNWGLMLVPDPAVDRVFPDAGKSFTRKPDLKEDLDSQALGYRAGREISFQKKVPAAQESLLNV